MSSKPTKREDVLDVIGKLKKQQRRINGQNRQNYTGLASADFGSTSFSASTGGSSTSQPNDTQQRLKTGGDTMMGPLAFSTKTKSLLVGVLDISEDTGSGYSSYVIASAGAGVNDLNTISGAQFNGQLLFLDAPATVTIRLKHNIGNIFIPDEVDFDLIPNSVGILIYDYTITKWNFVSSFVRGGGAQTPWTSNIDAAGYNLTNIGLLSSTTLAVSGAASFNGGTTTIGDSSSDSLSIFARVSTEITPTTTNTYDLGTSPLRWRNIFASGSITLSGNINMNGVGNNIINCGDMSSTTITVSGLASLNGSVSLGNASTDIITFSGKVGSDINLNTYDIYNVNRLKLGQTAGSGDDLLSTDTGIQSLYSGGLPFGMKLQIPSTNSAVYSIYRGTTEIINISSLGTTISTDTYLGSSSSSDVNVYGRVRAGNATEIGIYVDNSTTSIGSQGTMGLPYISSAENTPSDATIDGWFGNRNGNIGIQYYSTGGQNRIWIRSNNTWTVAYAT